MDTYGLIGYPLKHSFSAAFFSEKFRRERIDAEYLNFEIPNISELSDIISSHPTLKGLNVTIPYKEVVIPFLDEISDEAKEIGAVNVIKIERCSDGHVSLKGFNSDYIGFRESISPLIRSEIHKKALILGTGGASKAVRQALNDFGIENRFVSRTKSEHNFSYGELTKEILQEYTVIVNSSPIGTFPKSDEYPAIPYEFLTSNHLLYDLVYNPAETLFLKKGKAQGAIVKNGAEMLERQAVAAWEIWTDAEKII